MQEHVAKATQMKELWRLEEDLFNKPKPLLDKSRPLIGLLPEVVVAHGLTLVVKCA